MESFYIEPGLNKGAPRPYGRWASGVVSLVDGSVWRSRPSRTSRAERAEEVPVSKGGQGTRDTDIDDSTATTDHSLKKDRKGTTPVHKTVLFCSSFNRKRGSKNGCSSRPDEVVVDGYETIEPR